MWNSGREQEGLTQLQRLPRSSASPAAAHSLLQTPVSLPVPTSSQLSAGSGFVKWLYKVWKSAQHAPVLTKQRSCLICILPESPRIIFCATVHRRAQRIGEGEVRHLWVDAPRPSAARDTQWFSGHCGLRSSCSILKWP